MSNSLPNHDHRSHQRVPSELPKITGYLDTDLHEKVLHVAKQRQFNKSELVTIALKILVSIPDEAWEVCKQIGEDEFRSPEDQLRAEITKAMEALVQKNRK